MNLMLQKIKAVGEQWFFLILLVLVATMSFGLGRLSKIAASREPITITSAPNVPAVASQTAAVDLPTPKVGEGSPNLDARRPSGQATLTSSNQSGQVVGSKSGSKYHFPWCSGAQRIKAENKITFESAAKAREAGYTPAANCPGLE